MSRESIDKHAVRAVAAPLYEGVKQYILERIQSREWLPESRIPSEHELVRRLGVSRVTVNRALSDLSEENRLVRIQGVGTFVASGKSESNILSIRSIADEIATRGHRHRVEILALETCPATGEHADRLGLDEGRPVFHSLMVHFENEQALQLEDRYVNPDMAPDYLAQDFHSRTPHDYLMACAPLTEADHVIEAVMPTPGQRELLAMADDEPCLLVTRHTRSLRGPVSFALLAHPGSRYRLQGHIDR